MNRPTVLFSFAKPGNKSNPYVNQLVDAVQTDANVLFFDWKTAFTRRYDVFHVHWPEWLVRGRGRFERFRKPLLFALLLIRIRLTNTKIVRTVHNKSAHEPIGAAGRFLIRRLEKMTAATIELNESTLAGARTVVIPHGHYRDWYALPEGSVSADERQLLFIGMVRPYKGIEDVIDAFKADRSADIRFKVMGTPANRAYADALVSRAGDDTRIEFHFGYVDDADFSRSILESALVVLPYRDLHNSGALIAALSVGRPVLVPRNPVSIAHAAEFGSDWLITYEPPLCIEDILLALKTAEVAVASGLPNLSAREWPDAGKAHLQVYNEVIQK